VIRLENFPAKLLSGAVDPHDETSRERARVRFKTVRDGVLRWLYRLEDRGAVSLRNGGSLGNGIGWCSSSYRAGRYRGVLSAVVIALGPRRAMLIMHLAESRR
jgi:hypothetical protein